jgi:protein Tex
LVHISQLADKFVKDPHEIVKPGDVVQVKVLEVDLKRNRISLTMKMQEAHVKDETSKPRQDSISHKRKNTLESSTKLKKGSKLKAEPVTQGGNAMAEALAKAGLKRK